MDPITIKDTLVFVVLAILIIAGIAKVLLQRNWIKKRGVKTQGKVVDLIEKVEKGQHRNNYVDTITYFPEIEYTTGTFQKVREKHYIDRAPSVYQIGDKVSVVYDAKKPERFIIAP